MSNIDLSFPNCRPFYQDCPKPFTKEPVERKKFVAPIAITNNDYTSNFRRQNITKLSNLNPMPGGASVPKDQEEAKTLQNLTSPKKQNLEAPLIGIKNIKEPTSPSKVTKKIRFAQNGTFYLDSGDSSCEVKSSQARYPTQAGNYTSINPVGPSNQSLPFSVNKPSEGDLSSLTTTNIKETINSPEKSSLPPVGSEKSNPNVPHEKFKTLQKDLASIQKKTFTKWCNSCLEKERLEIRDLYKDLNNGKILWRLLEVISGESLGKPNPGKIRVHKLENVNVCLNFINTKVHLENIGAEDIVDGNDRLILGLIWTIILRFQIQNITIDLTKEETEKYCKDNGDLIEEQRTTSKNALLIWCRRQTQGYKGVDIQNFTSSWKNGLGFLALIHSHRPDLVDYETYPSTNGSYNLKEAFEIAEQDLGIYQLLDPEDVNSPCPDEKSILTYVSSLYHYFRKNKTTKTKGRTRRYPNGQVSRRLTTTLKSDTQPDSSLQIDNRIKNESIKDLNDINLKHKREKPISTSTNPIPTSISPVKNDTRNNNFYSSNNKKMADESTPREAAGTPEHEISSATVSKEESSSPSLLQQIKQKFTGGGTSSDTPPKSPTPPHESEPQSPVKSPPIVASSVTLLTASSPTKDSATRYTFADSSRDSPTPISDYYEHPSPKKAGAENSNMSTSTIIKKTVTTTRAGGASPGGYGYGGSSYGHSTSGGYESGGAGGGFGAASAASPKATIAFREKEKKELQDLNERFASYIERVRKLEKQHGELIEEIVSIKNELIRIVSSVRAQFESELRDARRDLDDTSRDKARLEVRCTRLEDDIDEYRQKYDDISRLHHSERDKLLRLEVLLSEKDGELANLQKKLDQANDDIERYKRDLERLLDELANAKVTNEDELLIRVDLENKLQSLQEDLDFQQQLHQATLKELMEGIRRDDSGEFKRIFQNELSLAIKDIRTEYDNISKMMYPDNEGWYKTKIQEFMELTQKKNVEELSAKDEAKKSRSRVSELSSEIIELRNSNSSLEKRIMELERAISNENSDFEAQLVKRDYEMQELQERIAAQLFELRELMDTKLRLDLEIAAYRRLLEGEENRLNLSPESIKHVRKAISQIGSREVMGGDSLSKILPGESSSKTTFQRTSKGPLSIAEVSPDGQFISVENTSKLKEQVIDGWQIRRNIDGRENIVYTIPKYTLRPGKTVKVFASGYYDGKSDNLEFRDRRSWGTGNNIITSLVTDKGEEKASHVQKTISH